MPSLFKSAVKQTVEVSDPYPSSATMVKELIASVEQHFPAGFVDYVSELYAKASQQVMTLAQDKTQGELIFMGAIVAAVLLFVVILPACELFSSSRTQKSKSAVTIKSVASSNSSATESLHTIEESEDEDAHDAAPVKEEVELVDREPVEDIINKSIEVPETLNIVNEGEDSHKSIETPQTLEFVDKEEEQVNETVEFVDKEEEQVYETVEFVNKEEEQVYEADIQMTKSEFDADEEEIDADQKISESTPVLEMPVSSPPATGPIATLTLTRDVYASTSNMGSTSIPRTSSMAKLKRKMSSSRLLGRKGSSDDASVSSTISLKDAFKRKISFSKK